MKCISITEQTLSAGRGGGWAVAGLATLRSADQKKGARARATTSRARGRAVNTDFMQYIQIYHRGHLKMAGQVFDDNIVPKS
jgi:hypothetical protein